MAAPGRNNGKREFNFACVGAPKRSRTEGSAVSKKYGHLFVAGLYPGHSFELVQALSANPTVSPMKLPTTNKYLQFEGSHAQNAFLPEIALGGAHRYALNPKAHLTDKDTTFSMSMNLQKQWNNYWSLSSSNLVEGSHSNFMRSTFIQKLFPDAAFVFLTCHPLESIYNMIDFLNDETVDPVLRHHELLHDELCCLIAKQWVKIHETLEKDFAKLKRAIVISNDTLIKHTEKALSEIDQLFGTQTPVPKEQFTLININERWSSESAELQQSLIQILQAPMEKFGYGFETLECLRPWENRYVEEKNNNLFSLLGGNVFQQNLKPNSFLLVGFGTPSDMVPLLTLQDELKFKSKDVFFLTNDIHQDSIQSLSSIFLKMSYPTTDNISWLQKNFMENGDEYIQQIETFLDANNIGCVIFGNLPFFASIFKSKNIECLCIRSHPYTGNSIADIVQKEKKIQNELVIKKLNELPETIYSPSKELLRDLKLRHTFLAYPKDYHKVGETGLPFHPVGWFLPTHITSLAIPEDLEMFCYGKPVLLHFDFEDVHQHPSIQKILAKLEKLKMTVILMGKGFEAQVEGQRVVGRKHLRSMIKKCKFVVHAGDFETSAIALEEQKLSLILPLSHAKGHFSWGKVIDELKEGIMIQTEDIGEFEEINKMSDIFRISSGITFEKGGGYLVVKEIDAYFSNTKKKKEREEQYELCKNATKAQITYLICKKSTQTPIETYQHANTVLQASL